MKPGCCVELRRLRAATANGLELTFSIFDPLAVGAYFKVMNSTGAIALSVLLISQFAFAETFVGPTTPANHLLVASNSAIIITTTLGDFTNSTQVILNEFPFQLDYFAPLENSTTYAVAGPAELVFSNAVVITYYQITNSTIHTQWIANDPIAITIASNKTLRLFGVPTAVNASFSRSNSFVSFTLKPNRPAEFTGPGVLALSSGVFPPYAKFISYFVAEDGFVLPDQRAISGPSGSFAVTLEKSADLKTWSPALLLNTSDEMKAFYRLRIER